MQDNCFVPHPHKISLKKNKRKTTRHKVLDFSTHFFFLRLKILGLNENSGIQ